MRWLATGWDELRIRSFRAAFGWAYAAGIRGAADTLMEGEGSGTTASPRATGARRSLFPDPPVFWRSTGAARNSTVGLVDDRDPFPDETGPEQRGLS